MVFGSFEFLEGVSQKDGVRMWACFPKTIKYKCFLAFDGRSSQNPTGNEKKDMAK